MLLRLRLSRLKGRRLGAIVVPDGVPPEVVAQLVKHILEEDLGK